MFTREQIDEYADSLPWETIIPAVFFLASAICLVDPSYAPTIAFALLGGASLSMASVMKYFTKPGAKVISEALTDSLVSLFTDDKNQQQSEKLFQAISQMISKSVQSTTLMSTIKTALEDMLTSDEFLRSLSRTVQNALLKVSEDQQLQQTVVETGKNAFIGALSDETLVNDLMDSIMATIVKASQNEKLNKTMLEVITQGMSNALEDERFVSVIRGAVKDTLKDKSLYQAGAKGLLSAANPFSSSSSSKKEGTG